MPVEAGFDCSLIYFAVALRSVAITNAEKRSIIKDGQKQPCSRQQFFVVQVAAIDIGWTAIDSTPGGRRGDSHLPEKRTCLQRHLRGHLGASGSELDRDDRGGANRLCVREHTLRRAHDVVAIRLRKLHIKNVDLKDIALARITDGYRSGQDMRPCTTNSRFENLVQLLGQPFLGNVVLGIRGYSLDPDLLSRTHLHDRP